MRRDKKNNEKKNNKGFSLVELIVVIAIMAILVAVLAPQFTKYVDRSRQSVDAATVSGIVTAAQVGVADVTDYNLGTGEYVITINKSGTTVAAGTSTPAPTAANITAMTKAITDACGAATTLKTTANAWDTITATVTVGSDYSVNVAYKSTKGAATDDDGAFTKYIGKTTTTSVPSTENKN